jgi:hypothetical protein
MTGGSPDASRPLTAHPRHMDEIQLTVRLDLLLTHDSVRGSVVGPSGVAAEFTGRLGLLAAIEELVRNAIPTLATSELDRSH